MARLPDLVRDSKLDTELEGNHTIHQYDESDDEDNPRPARRREYWEKRKILGVGGFGEVFLQECTQGKRERQLRAVKAIKKPRDTIQYTAELEIIAKFSHRRYHKRFVRSLGWYDAADTVYIVMDYFHLGDLQGYMSSRKDPVDEEAAREIICQTMEGLQDMHSEGFAHRDIKPNNILIKSQPPTGSWWIKLADFGISKRLELSHQIPSTVKGTPGYMAPELFYYEPQSSETIDFQAADMWSVGEMAFRLMTQTAAFSSLHNLVRYLTQPKKLFPSDKLVQNGISQDAVNFISCLMNPDPDERGHPEQALHQSWLQQCVAPSQTIQERVEPEDSRYELRNHLSANHARSDINEGIGRVPVPTPDAAASFEIDTLATLTSRLRISDASADPVGGNKTQEQITSSQDIAPRKSLQFTETAHAERHESCSSVHEESIVFEDERHTFQISENKIFKNIGSFRLGNQVFDSFPLMKPPGYDPILKLVCSPNGKWIAVLNGERISIFQTDMRGRLLQEIRARGDSLQLPRSENSFKDLDFSQDETSFAILVDANFAIWKMQPHTGIFQEVQRATPNLSITAIAFSTDPYSSWLACCSKEGRIQIYDTSDWSNFEAKHADLKHGPDSSVHVAFFSNRLLAIRNDNFIQIWAIYPDYSPPKIVANYKWNYWNNAPKDYMHYKRDFESHSIQFLDNNKLVSRTQDYIEILILNDQLHIEHVQVIRTNFGAHVVFSPSQAGKTLDWIAAPIQGVWGADGLCGKDGYGFPAGKYVYKQGRYKEELFYVRVSASGYQDYLELCSVSRTWEPFKTLCERDRPTLGPVRGIIRPKTDTP